MKEFQNTNPVLKDNFMINKYPQDRKPIMHENIKFLDKLPKKNLPELRLTKIKMRPGSNPELENNGKNTISNKTGLKYAPLIPKAYKNNSLVRKTELMFPKIKNGKINNFGNEPERNMIVTNYNSNNMNKHSSKRKNIHSTRNAKTKTMYGSYGVNLNSNINNNINSNINNNQFQNRNNFNDFNERINDAEKNNIDNNSLNNNNLNVFNIQKIKSKIPRYPRGNKSMPSKITTKVKKIKKEKTNNNVVSSLTIKPLINYPKNNNYLPTNNIYNTINNNINNNNYNININNNLIPSTINNTNNLNSLKQTPAPMPTSTAGTFSEYELMAERLNMIQKLFSSLIGGQNPFYDANRVQKTVELSPEIFNNTYKNFIPSVISSPNEFTQTDIIKGYAYNSSMGNIRDYNEDTITAAKIILNNENKNDDFYFFGVYDGHGGSGCSLYLKNNLHKLVKNFSKDSIKEAINEIEERFLKNEALDSKGELKDQSGSCGIMAMIQKNKCIIANVGDSRLIIFKNKELSFCTEDHKPGTKLEKERITKAGGKVYQTPSLFPLYQNGKEIEIPWRVLPGRLSVSRTFGDIEAKDPKFEGNKNVVVALPDITEIELSEEYNLIVLGCDGIFDVLSNEEILECVKIVLKEKKIKDIKEINISELCGHFASMIIKSALAKDSFDNVSCIVIAINIGDLID